MSALVRLRLCFAHEATGEAKTRRATWMSTLSLELDSAVVDVLRQRDQPIERTALELIIVELYRRHAISLGKAAELLGMPLADLIDYAAELDIPYFDMTTAEWEAEVAEVARIAERL
jgi:predicted HTH domain antitoxin